MTINDPRLPLLGEALQEAAAADLARTDETRTAPKRSDEARPQRQTRPRTRIGTRTASIPAGNFSFAGTEPTCTTVREGLEYDCALDQPPNGEVPPGSGRFVIKPGDWFGVVEPTADATKHVNGGCRSQNAEGTRWTCYLAKESVRQNILAPAALGEYLPSPAGP